MLPEDGRKKLLVWLWSRAKMLGRRWGAEAPAEFKWECGGKLHALGSCLDALCQLRESFSPFAAQEVISRFVLPR